MKTEIEHVQHLLQKSKVQIQRAFEEWWGKKSQSSVNKSTVSPRAAWRTPPPHLSGPPTNQSHQEQAQSSQISPTSSHRLKRHQEAIAAQFSHLQQQSTGSEGRRHHQQPPSSGGEHRTGQDRAGGHRDGTKTYHSSRQLAGGGAEYGTGQDHGGGGGGGAKPGSLRYHSSWEQADSFSPPVAARDVQRENGKTHTRSPRGMTNSPKHEHLSKKKHLFPADTDHNLNSHSLRFVLAS